MWSSFRTIPVFVLLALCCGLSLAQGAESGIPGSRDPDPDQGPRSIQETLQKMRIDKEKKDVTVVYVPEERTVEILLTALPPSPEVKWWNPRTGENSAAVAVITDTTAQFPTPGEGDWILWMQTQVKK